MKRKARSNISVIVHYAYEHAQFFLILRWTYLEYGVNLLSPRSEASGCKSIPKPIRLFVLGYVRYSHIPDDVQIGHHGKERELAGIEKGKYSREYDKDLQNLAPDHAEKAVVRLAVVSALDRALEGISGTESAEFSRRTTVQIRKSHQGTKRTGRFAKIIERNCGEGWYV